MMMMMMMRKDGGNIYNILPDMISNLSVSGCTSERFRNIMKFIFAFIDKEKQTESLIERLCQQRIRAASDDSQVADIVFCLSLLNFSEKGFKKLAENYKYYNDKLINDAVFNSFLLIIQKAKKNAKPEMKIDIEELENKITSMHKGTLPEESAMMDVEEEDDNDAEKPISPPAQRKKRSPVSNRRKKRKSR